jgi:hypothetical protein
MRGAFTEIIDYAGLFPPATCSMADAVRLYDVYRRSSDRWMLGRFVVSASRLEELGEALRAGGVQPDPADPWRLAVVMGAVVPTELERITAFGANWPAAEVVADTIEYRVSAVGQVLELDRQIPRTFRRFFEVPAGPDTAAIVASIGSIGAFAKIRTGGTSADLFPTAKDLTTFIMAAVKHGVPFKATAGLHHPFHGSYPITYAPDAERQPMYGFVNLLVATAEALRGGDPEIVATILRSERGAFARGSDTLSWDEDPYTLAELVDAHTRFFLGFGSCSFREPYDELDLDRAA